MSSPSRNFPAWLRLLAAVWGAIVILAALGALGYEGFITWAVWKVNHMPGKQVPPNLLANLLASIAGRVMGSIVCLFLGVRALQFGLKKQGQSGDLAVDGAGQAFESAGAVKPVRRAAPKRWQSCNVLQLLPEGRHLWAFTAARGGFSLNRQQTIPSATPLPAKAVAKDWKTLFQPRLNVAWLPADQVFLRVAQLPPGDIDETIAMVDLQLEKLSPLPVTQIVWSIQVLPHQVDNLQTVIVVIVARDIVEGFLGKLEEQGYLADQLELPMLDQLLATPVSGDGAWIYAGQSGGAFTALVAWWYGGALRNLGLLHVPAVENRHDLLKEQLMQMAWAGELEGWLTSPPRWHLVADETTAMDWQPMFRSWLGQSADVVAPLSQSELAALTARRAARSGPKANILPAEYSERYHRQFVDRLWLRGLMAVLAIYGLGVMIYFAALQYQDYRTDNATNEAARLSHEYTNTLVLKDQLALLQEREELKFAALNCWKVTAELLPEGMTLISMEFRNGKTLVLNGKVSADEKGLIADFNEALRKHTDNGGQLFFAKVEPPIEKLIDGNSAVSWNFNAELAHSEETPQ